MKGIKKIGLIVNPVAGLGGKAGLKGSDGEEIQAEALKKGVRPEANMKAERALEQLLPLRDRLEIVTYEGVMVSMYRLLEEKHLRDMQLQRIRRGWQRLLLAKKWI